MYDRFDHEQQIMDCWRVVDDLSTLAEGVMENNLTTDQITNIIIGMEAIYNLKFDKLFRTFEDSINQTMFARADANTNRAEMIQDHWDLAREDEEKSKKKRKKAKPSKKD